MARKAKKAAAVADPVLEYARRVIAGEVIAGPFVRAACERHLRDLVDGPARGLRWDLTAATRAIEFFPDILRHSEGVHAGKPFVLSDFQAFKVGSLFGWKNAEGFRRFRMAYMEEGKGSGKSPLAAGIGLYMLTADNEPGAEVYAAAVTRDQAQICFQDAVKMVNASPDLDARIDRSGSKSVYNLAHFESGSFFRPLSSEGKSLDGKRPHCILVDELHEHPTGIVVEKLSAGTKGRRQSLVVMITNSGFDRTSVCFQYREYAIRVMAAVDAPVDDEFFAFICGLDEDDDPLEDETCWIKANPNLGVSLTLQYLRKQVREARGMPAKASIVRRLNFCQWVDAENPWIDGATWRAREVAPVEFDALHALKGRDVFAALDLSGTKDLTALGLMTRDDAGDWDAAVEFWTPRDTIGDRSKNDRVPFDAWADAGFVTATPGRAVDYRFVAQRLVEIQQECNLLGVAFDPYRIKYLEQALDDIGAEVLLVPHPQGFYKAAEKDNDDGVARALWMPRSIELLEALIAGPPAPDAEPDPNDAAAVADYARRQQLRAAVASSTIRIRRNPCLTWNAASAVLDSDLKENKIFAKRRSRGRIDGVVALAMCAGFALEGATSARSVYEERGLLML